VKFPAGVRDDTRAPLVREREAKQILVREIIWDGPRLLPLLGRNRCPGPFLIFFLFLLFLFCYFDLFITFAFWIQIASIQFLNFSKNQGDKLGQ
jgi:hypothetical protein